MNRWFWLCLFSCECVLNCPFYFPGTSRTCWNSRTCGPARTGRMFQKLTIQYKKAYHCKTVIHVVHHSKCSSVSEYFRGQMVSQVLVGNKAWTGPKEMKDKEALRGHLVLLDYRWRLLFIPNLHSFISDFVPETVLIAISAFVGDARTIRRERRERACRLNGESYSAISAHTTLISSPLLWSSVSLKSVLNTPFQTYCTLLHGFDFVSVLSDMKCWPDF